MYLMKRTKSALYHGKPCPFCKRPMDHDDRHLQPTRDHYPVPYSKGGRRVVICCYVCNNQKSDMTAAEWHAYMDATPAWWLLNKRERKQRRAASKEVARTEKWGPRYVETEVELYRGRMSRNRIVAPPLEQTRQFLKQASLRALRKDEPIPITYAADPKAQAAFEAVYKNRKYLLRVAAEENGE